MWVKITNLNKLLYLFGISWKIYKNKYIYILKKKIKQNRFDGDQFRKKISQVSNNMFWMIHILGIHKTFRNIIFINFI